jgi:hypothetical protein
MDDKQEARIRVLLFFAICSGVQLRQAAIPFAAT